MLHQLSQNRRYIMALFGQSKKEKELQDQINFLRSQLNPAQQNALALRDQIIQLENQKKWYEQELAKLSHQMHSLNERVGQLNEEISEKSSYIVNLNDDIAMQDYGLYRPSFNFANSDMYKDRLKETRDKQKAFIKNGIACSGNVNWTINGNKTQGKKMVKDMQKLLLRAFNVECDDIVANVKVSNITKSKDRMIKIKNQISELGAIMSISIRPEYLGLKIEELYLALDFAQKKQEEKERIREERERQREEAKAQKEIEEARKKLQKEQLHYQNALDSILDQIRRSGETPDLIEKRDKFMAQISDTQKAINDVDYREANKRAGYVYIISNIGAFGENIYKIGMTRRLEPMDRVNELGDASVPFNFDVHALIFTDDAPKLESALHNAFESKKVNKINGRREFFNVTLDEIKSVVRANFDKTVEWTDVAEAEQYRQSLIMDPTAAPRVRNNSPQPIVRNNPAPISNTLSNRTERNPISSPSVPATIQDISAEIKRIANERVLECKCIEEDIPDCIRIHIYTSNNQKAATIKIMKSDMSIQLRKFSNGMPVSVPLSSPAELKSHF